MIIPLVIGDEAHFITFLYFRNFVLGTFYQFSLHIGDDDILQREGEAPNGSLLKAHRFHSVEKLGSFAGSGLGKDITDQRSVLFLPRVLFTYSISSCRILLNSTRPVLVLMIS